MQSLREFWELWKVTVLQLLCEFWEMPSDLMRLTLRETKDASRRVIVVALSAGLGADDRPSAQCRKVVEEACRLYDHGLGEAIIFSTGKNQPAPVSQSSAMAMAQYALRDLGLQARVRTAKDIEIENASCNTRENAEEISKMIREGYFWAESIILVCHPLHQRRAYLCFLEALRKARLKIRIWNVPAAYSERWDLIPGYPHQTSPRRYLLYEIAATIYFGFRGWIHPWDFIRSICSLISR